MGCKKVNCLGSVSVICLLILMCLAGNVCAARIGEKIGPLEITTLDGEKLVMNNYANDGKIGTVIAFMSARCEVTDAMSERINALQEKYRHKNILWVGIGRECGDELREFCQKQGMIFPVYQDVDGAIAKRFGAKVTPEVFLLDSQSRVVYHGAIGTSEDAALEAAIKAIRKNKEIAVKELAAEGTDINKVLPRREVEDLYGTIAFSSEVIFEKIPGAAAFHCSTITECANGDLLGLWYGGSYEASDDQKQYLARRKKGERFWSAPKAVAGSSLTPGGNAIIFTDNIGRVWILWGKKISDRPRRRGSGGTGRLFYRISNDNGYTWSEDRVFGREFGVKDGWGLRNVPTRLSTGEICLPISSKREPGQEFKDLYLMKTADNGLTWEVSSPYRGGSQPTVIERANGSLFVMLRGKPIIKQTLSADGGNTWTEAEDSILPNPNAGIALTRLDNGNIVLIFNNSSEDRTPLCLARSTDGGVSWEEPLELESNPGKYSYPCIIQTKDGMIHMTYTYRRYTIKHVELNENWLIHTNRPN